MGKPPNLIEVPDKSPEIDHEKDMAEHGANPKATKVTYIVVAVLFVVLFILVAFALHKPSGG
jgi:hypothetical protein